MAKPAFWVPDLTTFSRLDALDLTCIGQYVIAHKSILKCRPNTADDWCRRCGGHVDPRDTVIRKLMHEPFGHRPTVLSHQNSLLQMLRVRTVCAKTPVLRHQQERRSPDPDWALRGSVFDHDALSVIAKKLAVSWHSANSAVLAEGHRLLINDPNRFEGVSVIGGDEHGGATPGAAHSMTSVAVSSRKRRDMAGVQRTHYIERGELCILGLICSRADSKRGSGDSLLTRFTARSK